MCSLCSKSLYLGFYSKITIFTNTTFEVFRVFFSQCLFFFYLHLVIPRTDDYGDFCKIKVQKMSKYVDVIVHFHT